MAHSLKIRVVAEGVETDTQLAFLRSHCCDSVQGFLISRPAPATQVRDIIANASQLISSAVAESVE
jgi:EAL domain-containing protein (putative c-di-GMP-specific phosphodiesterase class I)